MSVSAVNSDMKIGYCQKSETEMRKPLSGRFTNPETQSLTSNKLSIEPLFTLSSVLRVNLA